MFVVLNFWALHFSSPMVLIPFRFDRLGVIAELIQFPFLSIIMNKGIGGGTGPTAAAAAAAAQKQKLLLQRVETDIANIVDNFTHLVNVSRVKLFHFYCNSLLWFICLIFLI